MSDEEAAWSIVKQARKMNYIDEMVPMIAAAIASEREACARIAASPGWDALGADAAQEIAKAIRARGSK